MIIKKDSEIIKAYLEDSSNLRLGYTEEVVVPEDIQELSQFLKRANAAGLGVTISGGGTGTTGSRIPFGGVVISMEKFNKILAVSRENACAILQSGVSVDALKRSAREAGMFYTSHPTEGTATVGGTVATNASGSRSFKYGPTRKHIKRLKMVLPCGDILDLRRGQIFLLKDNSRVTLPSGAEIDVPMPLYRMPDVKNAAGYFANDRMDLIDLFIGQEGTLSVIVEIEITLAIKPVKILSSFVFFHRDEDAWNFAARARDLSKANRLKQDTPAINALSIEYFDSNSLDILRARNVNIPQGSESAIFFEQETDPGNYEDKVLDKWLRLIAMYGVSLDDTWVAMNKKEADKFTEFRYAIPEALNGIFRKNGFQKFSTDIAVPDAVSLDMMMFYTSMLKDSKIAYIIFGHIGENHLHVNMMPKSEKEAELAGKLCMRLVKKGVSIGGTVSAEHGIGKIKHKYLREMYGSSGVAEMVKIKAAFDPKRILGLDNIFPRELLNF